MAADRRVHAAGHVHAVGRHHFGIQVVAHAVQLLEFPGVARGLRRIGRQPQPGHAMHRGDGVRVVGGEHRVHRVGAFQHAPGAGQVAHVGVGLAGEHRIAVVAIHLRALHLAVPVGALDQAHRDPAAVAARQVHGPVDHERGALLVGLDHQAEAFPAVQRSVVPCGFKHRQRQLQAVGFLRVHGQADAQAPGALGQAQQARCQLGQHALTLGVLVARVQGRELDRNGRRGNLVPERAVGADCIDRVVVGLEVALGIGGGHGRLAQHVERIAEIGVRALAAAGQGLADRAAHHELVAHDPHRLAHRQADHRLAHAAHQPLEGAVHVAFGLIGQVHQASGQHQPPGGGIDQHRFGLAHMLLPVGIAELVADQLVGGVLVGDAQQRLGYRHQHHAFLAGQVVLLHESLNHALVLGAGADAAYQVGGRDLDRLAILVRQAGLFEQFLEVGGFVARPCRGDLRHGGRR